MKLARQLDLYVFVERSSFNNILSEQPLTGPKHFGLLTSIIVIVQLSKVSYFKTKDPEKLGRDKCKVH